MPVYLFVCLSVEVFFLLSLLLSAGVADRHSSGWISFVCGAARICTCGHSLQRRRRVRRLLGQSLRLPGARLPLLEAESDDRLSLQLRRRRRRRRRENTGHELRRIEMHRGRYVLTYTYTGCYTYIYICIYIYTYAGCGSCLLEEPRGMVLSGRGLHEAACVCFFLPFFLLGKTSVVLTSHSRRKDKRAGCGPVCTDTGGMRRMSHRLCLFPLEQSRKLS